MEIENQYPIGKLHKEAFSTTLRDRFIADIEFLPNAVEAAIHNLDAAQLHTPYREGGWTVHQLVHHLADSHMNAYERFKLGYTEDTPVIKPYNENAWVMLADVTELPVNISITLLYALHIRWVTFLKSFADADWDKTIFHPQYERAFSLWHNLQVYAWHGRHHVAQINFLRNKMKW